MQRQPCPSSEAALAVWSAPPAKGPHNLDYLGGLLGVRVDLIRAYLRLHDYRAVLAQGQLAETTINTFRAIVPNDPGVADMACDIHAGVGDAELALGDRAAANAAFHTALAEAKQYFALANNDPQKAARVASLTAKAK